MTTYCFKCKECGAKRVVGGLDGEGVDCFECSARMVRDWKGEGTALLRENIRAVPRG